MTRGHAASFLEQEWQLFDNADAARQRATLPVDRVVLGDALRAHAAAVQPSWPRADDRAVDHAHHLRLIDILSRVERQRR